MFSKISAEPGRESYSCAYIQAPILRCPVLTNIGAVPKVLLLKSELRREPSRHRGTHTRTAIVKHAND